MNPLQAVIDYLKANAGVAALAGTRVWYGAGRVIGRSDFPCVLAARVPMEGGDPDDEAPTQKALIDIRCYGNNQPQAQQLAQAVRAALHGATFAPAGAGHVIIGASMRLEPADIIDTPGDGSEFWDCVFMTVEIEVSSA